MYHHQSRKHASTTIQLRNCTISSKMNRVERLSRLGGDRSEKIIPKIRENISIKLVDVEIGSLRFVPEKQVFCETGRPTQLEEDDIAKHKTEICNTISSDTPIITVASYYLITSAREPSTRDKAQLTEKNKNPI